MRPVHASIIAVAVAAAACTPGPAEVATEYMHGVVDGDPAGVQAMLTTPDRAAVGPERFAELAYDLPIRFDRIGTTVDSAQVVALSGDAADVVVFSTPPAELHAGTARDTVHLVREAGPKTLLSRIRDTGVWRVELGLAARAHLEELAMPLRRRYDERPMAERAADARTYLEEAERHIRYAKPTDMVRARDLIRAQEVATRLRMDLRLDDTAPGTRRILGRLRNTTDARIGIVRLEVEDAAGTTEVVEVWGIAPNAEVPVEQATRLAGEPLNVRVLSLDILGA